MWGLDLCLQLNASVFPCWGDTENKVGR